jgi:hypothetical protein
VRTWPIELVETFMIAAIIVWRAVNHYGFPSDEAATKCDGATQEEALLRMKSLVLWMLHGPATKTTATH